MISNFYPTIGIEVHCALNTKSKMFSPAPNSHNSQPNTNINEIDLGMIGTLPSVNKEAVAKAIKLATALHMNVDSNLYFDRKNYFYQDLPKGFQITQQYNPIGKDGFITLDNGKRINVERIHMEEDTAKEQVINGKILLDYNRAGVPLIEIVSRPDLHSSREAVEYLTKLKRILVFLNISDGKMEDGSLRADVNVSVNLLGSKTLGAKVEIKNLNSFAAIAKAIDYELERQSKELLFNHEILQSTLKWNDQTNQTEFMRAKINAVDYHYFTEPNIVNIRLDDKWVGEIVKNLGMLPEQIASYLSQQGLNDKIINQLLDDYDLYKIFINVYEKTKNLNLTVTWVVVELAGYLKEHNLSYSQISNDKIELIAQLINLLNSGDINGKQAKVVFPLMLESNKAPNVIMQEQNMVQIKDPVQLRTMLTKIVEDNQTMLNQYETRSERVIKFYIGLLMRDTHGQANPNVATQVLQEIISQKLKK